MANNPTEIPGDDFLHEILGVKSFTTPDVGLLGGASSGISCQMPMLHHVRTDDDTGQLLCDPRVGDRDDVRFLSFPLEPGFEQDDNGLGFSKTKVVDESCSRKRFRDEGIAGDRHTRLGNSDSEATNPVFLGQPIPTGLTAAGPPPMRPRVRARRGQATDPHSIAERLRRERIAERIRALQELVPNVNKTDRAAMLDEIVDYVKFLRLQVKVLSMSRLGGAGAVAPLVMDIPVPSAEDDCNESQRNQSALNKWSNDGTERQVAKLMEENVGAAMQFLQSKSLCIMPISLATTIFQSQQPEAAPVKSESHLPS